MNTQLTYVIITPYSLLKSRTGGIIGRLLSLTKDLEFAGARMYSPSAEFLARYKQTLALEDMSDLARSAMNDYIQNALPPGNRFGISNRAMVLLFRGKDAVKSLQHVIGDLSRLMRGDTIRGTYGDFVTRQSGEVEFFEPAVLSPTNERANREQLRILHDFAMTDGGILEHVVKYPEGVTPQTTLVIIKPDNFLRKSARPGNIIDMFSRTGLYVVGAKLLQLTEAQATEFYGPLRAIFRSKLKGAIASKLREALKTTFRFAITESQYAQMAEVLADSNADAEFRRIVNYMTGSEENPWSSGASSGKCLALLYQGENAIEKIRERLGATNPDSAEPGTVRSTYGHDLMKNGAHASDSVENAERERKIIGLWEEGETCDTRELIAEYLHE
ncbi:MAG TPA: nucleoside-diphosphate kinase [Candidatus Brocadiia bacterium]|nr:nucleoside-diphosphate kinase [Candidatus Brocadiia bacterium]